MGRVLGYSVTVNPEDEVGVTAATYRPGTREEDIPESHLALITNDLAWEPSPVSDVPEEEREMGLIENDTAPASLDECNEDELRQIAERYEISIGKLRDPEKIRAVLREAGIGDDGNETAQ